MAERGIRDGVRRLFRLQLRGGAATRADADEELASLLDNRVEHLIARGATDAEARAAALRSLGSGSLDQARQHLHQSAVRRERRMRVRHWVESVAQDVRFGARQLARTPGITAIAILSLGVGIGANAAIFSVVDAILLRNLPVARPDQLIAIGRLTAINGHTTGAARGDLLSLPLYQDLSRDHSLVTALAATGTAARVSVRLGGGDADEHPNCRFVSANFFAMLGVPAERGRTFAAADGDGPGGSPVAVISDAYWRQRFGAADSVIGQRLSVNGATLTIIGVTRPGFEGAVAERPTQIWLPISSEPLVEAHGAPISDRATSWLLLLGRLAPGVTLQQARAGFTSRIRGILVANAASSGEAARMRREPVPVSPGGQGFSSARVTFRGALVTLQMGVALLLLIVCTNLANLLVGRAVTRQTEMSVRLALGAARSRLLRQLMTESILLVLLGASVGVGLAWWGSGAIGRVAASSDSPVPVAAALDARLLLFTFAVCVAAVLCFGVVPAWRASRAELASSMRAHARSVVSPAGRGGRVPVGAWLVPVQVALCLVLLTAAALLTRSLTKLESVDPGLDRDHLVLAQVDAVRLGVKGDAFVSLVQRLTDRLSGLPGVRAVTYSQNGLFIDMYSDAIAAIPGFVGRTADDSTLGYDLVGPGYAHAIGARLLRGRDLSPSDGARSPSVAVLNASAAAFYFGVKNPIGRSIYFDAGVPTTVVGVVADIRDRSMTAPVDRRAYVPYVQELADEPRPSLSLEIRTTGDPSLVIAEVRRTIRSVDPALPQVLVSSVADLVRGSIRDQRLLTTLATAFGCSALLLALVGLYGVMSHAVARRTAELGLRSALGAGRGAVLRLILGDGLRLVGIGLLVGVPSAWLAARVLRAQLHGVGAADPMSFGVALAAIAVCASLAALVPALRAARVSPAVALSQP